MLEAVYFRPLGDILKVVDPGLQGWILVLAASITPLLVGQLSMQIEKRFKIHMVSRKSFQVRAV
jgi:Ca2+-transporting ATPase